MKAYFYIKTPFIFRKVGEKNISKAVPVIKFAEKFKSVSWFEAVQMASDTRSVLDFKLEAFDKVDKAYIYIHEQGLKTQ